MNFVPSPKKCSPSFLRPAVSACTSENHKIQRWKSSFALDHLIPALPDTGFLSLYSIFSSALSSLALSRLNMVLSQCPVRSCWRGLEVIDTGTLWRCVVDLTTLVICIQTQCFPSASWVLCGHNSFRPIYSLCWTLTTKMEQKKWKCGFGFFLADSVHRVNSSEQPRGEIVRWRPPEYFVDEN